MVDANRTKISVGEYESVRNEYLNLAEIIDTHTASFFNAIKGMCDSKVLEGQVADNLNSFSVSVLRALRQDMTGILKDVGRALSPESGYIHRINASDHKDKMLKQWG